jgi:hypothetical protein
MRMLKRVGVLAIAAVLCGGAASAATGCGEDRDGEVEFQDGGTETTGTGTTGTETAGTETAPSTETTAETAPETDTAPETETTP